MSPHKPCSDSLLILANQAITPSNQQYNSATINNIIELINKDPGGASVSLRLIAHKIQSPQEREALNALKLLEVLATHCGANFQSELGKFKFLNELIKVLSPKHLGDQTTEAVKLGCARLLYQWHRDYSAKEPKFSEAYNMLCEQRLINPESLALNGSDSKHPDATVARQPNIFDRNKEYARLTKLLRSKNPANIVEANRIIQSIVEEDRNRMELATQRSTEMEALKNNTHLLNEMIKTYERGEGSVAEQELMEELAQNIRRARPLLYNFSLTHEEHDLETMTDIVRICDEASTTLDVYEKLVVVSIGPGRSANLPDSSSRSKSTLNQDLLSSDLLGLGIDAELPADSNASSLSTFPKPSYLHQDASQPNVYKCEELKDIFANLSSVPSLENSVQQATNLPIPITNTVHSPRPFISESLFLTALQKAPEVPSDKTNTSKMFDDLDSLGRRMLGFDTQPSVASAAPVSDLPAPTLSREPSPKSSVTDRFEKKLSSRGPLPFSPADFSQLDVALSAIQPHPTVQKPYVIYPTKSNSDSGIELALHYASNQPVPSVRVFVATLSNRSPFPVTDIFVRFGVKKPRLLRQLTPSGNSLAPHCSFIPNSAVNQVILIFDPLNECRH
ncbi:unnamed protein product [Dicrocoelium dendriticum]|nr:unnamed protein product [Dicrocoelium dendriticum]